jgi:hypothetical protein
MGTCGRSPPVSRQSTKRAVRQSRRWVPDGDAGMTANMTPSVSTTDSAVTKTNVHTGGPVWTIVGSGGGESGDDTVRVVRSGEVFERVVHGGQIELVRVETTANPLRPVLMLIVLRVAHRREERLISPRSADVLRRAGPPASDA